MIYLLTKDRLGIEMMGTQGDGESVVGQRELMEGGCGSKYLW